MYHYFVISTPIPSSTISVIKDLGVVPVIGTILGTILGATVSIIIFRYQTKKELKSKKKDVSRELLNLITSSISVVEDVVWFATHFKKDKKDEIKKLVGRIQEADRMFSEAQVLLNLYLPVSISSDWEKLSEKRMDLLREISEAMSKTTKSIKMRKMHSWQQYEVEYTKFVTKIRSWTESSED